MQTGGLACNYYDRYVTTLVKQGVVGNMRALLTIATTCLLISAKFFDRKLPPLSELERLHHGHTTAAEFQQLELRILSGLKWELHVPMPHSFVEPILALCKDETYDNVVEDRMYFFIDLSVYGYNLLVYSPAQITAASLLVAWKFSNEHAAVPRNLHMLAAAVGSDSQHLSRCANDLVRYYKLNFPEAAKTFDAINLFLPIHVETEEDLKALELSRSEAPDSTIPTSLGGAAEQSPDSVIPLPPSAPKKKPVKPKRKLTDCFEAGFDELGDNTPQQRRAGCQADTPEPSGLAKPTQEHGLVSPYVSGDFTASNLPPEERDSMREELAERCVRKRGDGCGGALAMVVASEC